ncbi:MAG: sulfite exporter TauE/SafE family protein [Pseudomonadota bacterium]
MISTDLLLLIPLIFLAALLFSSVGHGGASAYLAVFALAGMAPESMRSSALCLNVLVASIALFKFYKVRAFDWRLLWPIALTSIPMAFIGGQMSLPNQVYKVIVGLCLLYAAWTIFDNANKTDEITVKPVSKPILMLLGMSLGFLSGLTGVGGGIFLSPILLYFGWAKTKVISGVAAAFILVNSISGLFGVLSKSLTFPAGLLYWAFAAVIGGLIGAEFGSRKLSNPTIRKLLALVLVLAGGKMLTVVL